MKPFTTFTGKTIPLPLKDIDTDMIIPAQFLTSISTEGYGENLFIRLRKQNPSFPFNLPCYAGASILLADTNFGCGSSREHAVWALTGWGIRAVIAKSFADIFFSNSAKNGLLLVTLPSPVVDNLLEAAKDGHGSLTINLEEQKVITPAGEKHSFEYEEFRKHCLLHGLDDFEYIMSHREKIDSYWKLQEEDRTIKTIK